MNKPRNPKIQHLRQGQLSLGQSSSKSAVPLWGLTGGVASGKSSVAQIFASFGIPVLDADEIVRELSGPRGAARDAILKRFGTADRTQLRERVFSDAAAKRDLEAILHPLVQAETLERAKKFVAAKVVIYEAALLVETGRYQSMSGLIVVHSPRELRKQRLITRDGHSEQLAEKILSSQTTDEARLNAATFVIENSGTLEDLKVQVRKLCQDQGWIT